MPSAGNKLGSTVIPCLSYRNAPAAIEWLCDTIGFEKQAVYPADDGTIRRARIGCAPFGERHKRPAHLPERITHYHFWSVDVCPVAKKG